MSTSDVRKLVYGEKSLGPDYKTLAFPSVITFFVTFALLMFHSGVCFPFNIGNEVIFKKSNRKKAPKSI